MTSNFFMFFPPFPKLEFPQSAGDELNKTLTINDLNLWTPNCMELRQGFQKDKLAVRLGAGIGKFSAGKRGGSRCWNKACFPKGIV